MRDQRVVRTAVMLALRKSRRNENATSGTDTTQVHTVSVAAVGTRTSEEEGENVVADSDLEECLVDHAMTDSMAQ